ncbi:MAG: geranylgeranyl reductase family protein [Candidatus Bathyarchaeota archaeon]|nr:geranylgeranyl reductase family protein [Candidatus Bathyarchaeota archaeon]
MGIVGAGVAGSTCARVLGEAGVKVAIFDHSHPREKPCGGFIEDRVVEEFKIPEALLENEVKWSLNERFKLRTRFQFEQSQFLVSRKDFDSYLLQEALKNNSVVHLNEKVVQVTAEKEKWMLRTNRGKCVKVSLLIGADGCPSLTRKYVYRPIPQSFLTMTVGYDLPCSSQYLERNFAKNTVEVYYSRKYVKKGGFIWIFPKRTKINIGIGSRESGFNLKQALDSFIAVHPAGARLKNIEGQFFAHLIPTVWMAQFFDLPCSGNNWALIGDAAGHVNPVGGLGIYYAMKGGILCGKALLDGDIHLFEDYWRKEYGDELYYAASAVSKFYSASGFALWLPYVFRNLLTKSRHSRY